MAFDFLSMLEVFDLLNSSFIMLYIPVLAFWKTKKVRSIPLTFRELSLSFQDSHHSWLSTVAGPFWIMSIFLLVVIFHTDVLHYSWFVFNRPVSFSASGTHHVSFPGRDYKWHLAEIYRSASGLQQLSFSSQWRLIKYSDVLKRGPTDSFSIYLVANKKASP